MAQNRRARVADFYRSLGQPHQLSSRAAAAAARYAFRGNNIVQGAVVRVDLNGYSKWAAERTIQDRVILLNDFFSRVVPLLEDSGGVFFRDEGDCIVGLFSNYFDPSFQWTRALDFAQAAVLGNYGPHRFSVKAAIASSRASADIAIFQKTHERASGDWSAEGQPFVAGARLEAAIPSRARIYMRTDEYNAHFKPYLKFGVPAGSAHWNHVPAKLQGEGFGEPGGWIDVTYIEYVS